MDIFDKIGDFVNFLVDLLLFELPTPDQNGKIDGNLILYLAISIIISFFIRKAMDDPQTENKERLMTSGWITILVIAPTVYFGARLLCWFQINMKMCSIQIRPVLNASIASAVLTNLGDVLKTYITLNFYDNNSKLLVKKGSLPDHIATMVVSVPSLVYVAYLFNLYTHLEWYQYMYLILAGMIFAAPFFITWKMAKTRWQKYPNVEPKI